MPHIILAGEINLDEMAAGFEPTVHRWGRVVLKSAECWLRRDHRALLVEGVVVELSRPLHPVVMVAVSGGATQIRIWPRVELERTGAVQRFLALVAADLQRRGGGLMTTTNLPFDLWEGVGLQPVQ